jgi:2-polyprenyl-3-methyl-5-hydroxy-6-metoxy-1,4-benzoquinol methylase
MGFEKERRWWDGNAASFDTIYSGKKGAFAVFLDRIFRWDIEGRLLFALEKTAPAPGMRILDVACGTGRFAHRCAERGAQVVGVDISEKMLDIAAEITSERQVQGCTYILGDFMETTFDGLFDAVVALGLFDYLVEPDLFLRKMFSHSRGPVVASFPRKGTFRALLRSIRLKLLGCPVYFYSEDDIVNLAAAAGGRILENRRIGQLHCVLFESRITPERAS